MAIKRRATVYRLDPKNASEYKRRHDELWPELTDAMYAQGIHNYSIWYHDGYLFSYMEINEDEACDVLAPEFVEIGDRWSEYMKDILIPVTDEKTGEQVELPLMFYHN